LLLILLQNRNGSIGTTANTLANKQQFNYELGSIGC
jgi:hypothetical protein